MTLRQKYNHLFQDMDSHARTQSLKVLIFNYLPVKYLDTMLTLKYGDLILTDSAANGEYDDIVDSIMFNYYMQWNGYIDSLFNFFNVGKGGNTITTTVTRKEGYTRTTEHSEIPYNESDYSRDSKDVETYTPVEEFGSSTQQTSDRIDNYTMFLNYLKNNYLFNIIYRDVVSLLTTNLIPLEGSIYNGSAADL